MDVIENSNENIYSTLILLKKNTEENALHAMPGFLILGFQKYICRGLVDVAT